MTPIPLDVLVPLLNVLVDPSHVLILLVNRINRVPNPAFLPTPETAVDDRFPRLVALVKELSLANALKFVQSTEKEETFYLWIHDYAPTHTEQVNQLFNILDITGILRNGEDIFLPVSPGLQSQATKSISMHTRSVFRLARIAAATVDVPSEDREKGLTLEYPYLGLVGGLIKVRRSKERPINAVSATKYRGWWYYIYGGDHKSRISFAIFQALMDLVLAEGTGGARATPVLTIPASN